MMYLEPDDLRGASALKKELLHRIEALEASKANEGNQPVGDRDHWIRELVALSGKDEGESDADAAERHARSMGFSDMSAFLRWPTATFPSADRFSLLL